jgi:4-diphosphocytidyl-2-C-methyl-D-erythritol kinase
MTARLAHAKINLALVVGPVGANGKHELTTVFQRVGLADRLELEPADALAVEGFEDDSLVRGALDALAEAAAVEPAWRVRIEKEIPVAAGLGGGSSDAATALVLANETLDQPLSSDQLHELAARLGADVPFFLSPGPQLGEGDGSRLTPVEIPQGRTVALVVPGGAAKESTASVYRAFDQRNGADGYAERRAALLAALATGDLADLPRNDLASSPLAARLEDLGALRADVSGAGPAVYGLFADEAAAAEAVRAVGPHGWTWIGQEAW